MKPPKRIWLREMRRLSAGQSLAEYALILLLVLTVAVSAWTLVGTRVSSLVSSMSRNL
jgi:Flp pilus assembly pilin Flp